MMKFRDLSGSQFDGLVRSKPPVTLVTAHWEHDTNGQIVGFADNEEAAAQLIENCRKLPEYKAASFSTFSHIVWSKQKDA